MTEVVDVTIWAEAADDGGTRWCVEGEAVFNGPAADAGAVGFEVQAAVEFAGDATVRARRFGGEEFGGEGEGFRRPFGMMIATGETRGPSVGLAVGASEEVFGAELVETADADVQFERDHLGCNQAGTGLGEEMADKGSGEAVGELMRALWFFMGRKLTGRWI